MPRADRARGVPALAALVIPALSTLGVPALATLVVAVLGALVSAYLTWLHYSGTLALCLGSGGCEAVQASRYAELGGIPVALLGLVFFVAAAGLVGWRERTRGGHGGEAARLAFFGLTLTGTLFAAYLTYLELFVIGAICPWCVSVALATVTLFALALRDLAHG